MTVVFLTRRFYPDVGGVEKHVYEIGKRLVKDGYKVLVITESSGKDEMLDGIRIKRIKVHENWFKKFLIWRWLWKNRSLINKADIIHAHDVYYWFFPFRFLYPRKKSFVTFHGYESYPIRKKAILVRKISEKLSNGNIIVGDFIKKWYGTKPNFVIYGGVDLPKKILKPKKDSALFIGRLDEHTGILEYVKAWDEILKFSPEFSFTVIGEGKYRSDIPKEIKVYAKSNAEKEIQKYEYAFVSRYLSILEAMANRRLVFAVYNNPVKEDYLKMTPFKNFIVVAKNSEDLTKKIKYFLENPEKKSKMLERAYGWIIGNSWNEMVETYMKLWEKSLEK